MGKNKEGNDADSLESILHHVGDMGRYQILLFIAMLPFGFFFAYIYFVQMFIAVAPANYWCMVPELQHLDMELRRNLSAPGAASGSWDSCRTYDVNWSEVLETMTPPPEGTPMVRCQHGWDFEFTDIPYETVITERGWVCEYASYGPTAQAIFFAGSFTGGLFFGWLADNFGRVPALIGANLIGAIGGIGTIYTKDVWDFAFCRFLVGMAFDNAFMMMYILVLEYVGARHRTWVANMSIALFFGAGCISLPWLALWLSDWRKLLWFTSLPMLIVVFTPFFVPESARWLVSRGRVSQAVDVLRKFERVNGTKIPDDVLDEFVVKSNQTKQTKESILVLFKSSLIRNSLILMVMTFMSCAIIFDGLVRLSNAFGLNYFLTFTLTSATEIPSISLLTLVLDKWGRRNLTTVPMLTAGVMIIVALFVPKGIPQASLAIAARFCINMSYNTVIQWVTELLPTPVRASGSAAMHMSGYVAAVLSPFIVYSEVAWSQLPLLIIGITACVGSGISIMLPETKGLPMPQTMSDSEWIVREKSLCGKKTDKEDVECVSDKEKSFIT
ncbi:carcinine transporter-like isoform X2 [Anticarsia gemmatalis]|uniref:carcinine transporter-like isoform X2 n=1 Tax=Anticarsia gemmatalis TaxID=129554 RepID=UPI003F76EF17